MFAIEILHKFTPDQERREAAKVYDCSAEHLSHVDRVAIQAIMEAMEQAGNGASARSMQHVGPVGDALDLTATIAAAGEALCQFVLHRALMNPHELAAAKTGISECWLTVSEMLAKLDTEQMRNTMAALTAANEFMDWAPDRFVPLFEDLEAHAQRKFPHLAANQQGEETHV